LNLLAPSIRFLYTTGEDVVVRLNGVDVFNIERGVRVSGALLQLWTIGTVADRVEIDGEPSYLLRFEHNEEPCVCLAPESCIEGAA
jgi:hypothetical protein